MDIAMSGKVIVESDRFEFEERGAFANTAAIEITEQYNVVFSVMYYNCGRHILLNSHAPVCRLRRGNDNVFRPARIGASWPATLLCVCRHRQEGRGNGSG